MKRLMILCVIMTAVALIAGPAFAEVQNVKVSGDVNAGGVYRNSYNLYPASRNALTTSGEEGQDSDNNNFLYTQARVRIDADLTDNVMATIRLLSEYDWCTESNTAGDGDNLDIDLANVTLKEVFYAPLTVIVGRQELRYGTAFIIGDPDTNGTSADSNFTAADLSLRKSFDAVRAILDYNPLTVEGIFAKIDEQTGAATLPNTNENDDEDLFGVNVAYDLSDNNAEAEAYWFLNRDQNQDAATASTSHNTPGHDIHTFGLRGSIEPMENLNLLGEFALQRGDFETASQDSVTVKRKQESLAYQVAGDFTFADIEWMPVIRAGWTHYSGEGFADDGDYNAWIPLYEDQTHGVVANYILSGVNGGQNSNADILNIGASADVMEDLSVSIDYYNFLLDEKLVQAANTALVTTRGYNYVNLSEASIYANDSDELGYEIDIALNYDYTEDVKMGLSAGWFKPGKALEGEVSTERNDQTALQVLATLDVAF
ncbi:MAG: alginate export family protein [Candidatus Omnitrophica bacterium]|nr:alginate export family protein [Candidatus Omnitrophota bacterium]MBU4457134.1 alginate export family protein [Candidatus Omnitrophota bacterium]